MIKPRVGEKLTQFVKNGGTLLTTYFSGYVDETDLCFLGGFPGPLREVTGIWAEEIDTLKADDKNGLCLQNGNVLGLDGCYKVDTYCELVHTETAKTMAAYESDFYAGMPVLTVNSFGKGESWHLAAHADDAFLRDFYKKMAEKLSLKKALVADLPEGVTAQLRTNGHESFVFLMNFSEEVKCVEVQSTMKDVLSGKTEGKTIELPVYEVKVLTF